MSDDDVWWHLENLEPLLKELDPALPFYLSDALVGCCGGHCRGSLTLSCSMPWDGATEEQLRSYNRMHPLPWVETDPMWRALKT